MPALACSPCPSRLLHLQMVCNPLAKLASPKHARESRCFPACLASAQCPHLNCTLFGPRKAPMYGQEPCLRTGKSASLALPPAISDLLVTASPSASLLLYPHTSARHHSSSLLQVTNTICQDCSFLNRVLSAQQLSEWQHAHGIWSTCLMLRAAHQRGAHWTSTGQPSGTGCRLLGETPGAPGDPRD